MTGEPKPVNGSPDGDHTGLPVLRTWRAAYVFVLATFVLWLVLLWIVMRRFA